MEKELFELDFKKLFKIIWKKRIVIVITTICFTISGCIMAIFTPYEYTASTQMIPIKANGGYGSSNISQLASMAGFDLMGGLGNTQSVNPLLYPTLASSTPFLEELSFFEIKIQGFEESILLRDFLLNYDKLGILDIYRKDVLGKNINSLVKKSTNKKAKVSKNIDKKYTSFSSLDQSIYEMISNNISVSYAAREGILKIYATMPDPISAAELAQKTADLLQKTIIGQTIKKAYDELLFLENRHSEIQKEYIEKKNILAQFQDKNIDLISSRSNIKLNQLESDFQLTSNVFLQLSQQLESQKLKVKKETPVFSTIQPVYVPLIRSKPIRGNIVKTYIVFGVIAGILIVLLLNLIVNFKLTYKNLYGKDFTNQSQ